MGDFKLSDADDVRNSQASCSLLPFRGFHPKNMFFPQLAFMMARLVLAKCALRRKWQLDYVAQRIHPASDELDHSLRAI